MAENSKIEWTDHTVNFWWGCEKVSPACANCYAEGQAARFHPGHWGPGSMRWTRITQARNEAMRYERQAVKEVRRFRVFTNSMSDFFEDRRDLDGARLAALDVIRLTPHLDWLILTKRPGAIMGLLRAAETDAAGSGLSDWLRDWLKGKAPANVWLGTTVESQGYAILRISDLIRVPAAVHFLSCEPLLGPVDLEATNAFGRQKLWKEDQCLYAEVAYNYHNLQIPGIDWVIAGGESGPHARPMHPNWARSLRDQCAAAGVPFLFKQWGEWAPAMGDLWWHAIDGCPQFITRAGGVGTHAFGDGYGAVRIGKKAAGRLLDGIEHNGFPEVHHA